MGPLWTYLEYLCECLLQTQLKQGQWGRRLPEASRLKLLLIRITSLLQQQVPDQGC